MGNQTALVRGCVILALLAVETQVYNAVYAAALINLPESQRCIRLKCECTILMGWRLVRPFAVNTRNKSRGITKRPQEICPERSGSSSSRCARCNAYQKIIRHPHKSETP